MRILLEKRLSMLEWVTIHKGIGGSVYRSSIVIVEKFHSILYRNVFY
ncbi:hypothetical protein SAMN04487936_101444 [Halobacillus dabanensis]|uniref:Uncharacterized protein n=1 Tax=Halobacillus dabanensis TaxID=240302 RepID=A0A1I3PU42_HALDA|nr:hypothetical protein [Halobacillus dabanensis]SFJ25073.1 hypothetical protein SAMN04487936_101444 [Halobacillus dabanensis]